MESSASLHATATGLVTEVTHPLVQHKVGLLRDRETTTQMFRQLVNELTLLLTYEATMDLADEEVDVLGRARIGVARDGDAAAQRVPHAVLRERGRRFAHGDRDLRGEERERARQVGTPRRHPKASSDMESSWVTRETSSAVVMPRFTLSAPSSRSVIMRFV